MPSPPGRRWRRYFGPPNSWRRVTLTGIGAGVTLALFAAIAAAAIGSIGDGSVSNKLPATAPIRLDSSNVADDSQPPAGVPEDSAAVDQPTVDDSASVPADTPVEEEIVDTPTPEQILPADTPEEDTPTDIPPEVPPDAAE